jgi:hypothetical protein
VTVRLEGIGALQGRVVRRAVERIAIAFGRHPEFGLTPSARKNSASFTKEPARLTAVPLCCVSQPLPKQLIAPAWRLLICPTSPVSRSTRLSREHHLAKDVRGTLHLARMLGADHVVSQWSYASIDSLNVDVASE